MSDLSTNTPQTPVAVPEAQNNTEDTSLGSRQAETQKRVAEISTLLSALKEAASESGLISARPSAPVAVQHETRLVQASLKMASSLLTALRQKHAPTAAHSLRVALGCSSWALFAKLDEETGDTVELAALMHDIGKIGALREEAKPLTGVSCRAALCQACSICVTT